METSAHPGLSHEGSPPLPVGSINTSGKFLSGGLRWQCLQCYNNRLHGSAIGNGAALTACLRRATDASLYKYALEIEGGRPRALAPSAHLAASWLRHISCQPSPRRPLRRPLRHPAATGCDDGSAGHGTSALAHGPALDIEGFARLLRLTCWSSRLPLRPHLCECGRGSPRWTRQHPSSQAAPPESHPHADAVQCFWIACAAAHGTPTRLTASWLRHYTHAIPRSSSPANPPERGLSSSRRRHCLACATELPTEYASKLEADANPPIEVMVQAKEKHMATQNLSPVDDLRIELVQVIHRRSDVQAHFVSLRPVRHNRPPNDPQLPTRTQLELCERVSK